MGKIFFAILCIISLQLPVNSAQIYYGITGQPINPGAIPQTRYKMVKYDVIGRPAYTGHKTPVCNTRTLHEVKYNIAGIPVNQVGKQRSQIGVNNNSAASKTTASCKSNCSSNNHIVKPVNVRDRRVGSKIPQRVAVGCRGLVQYRNGKPICDK